MMIADLKPYPDYKHSSQVWLGNVPRHWSVVPNRALFAEMKDRNHPDDEMLSVTITKGIVSQKALLADSSKKDSSNADKSAYKLVQPGDIAYNKMRAWQGAIGVATLRGIISPAYVVMRLRNKDDLPAYFHHLYRTPQFAEEAERWSYGITSDMWSLRPEHFKMIYTPEPPRAEQAAIVRFLNWANGRLERAMRAKRKVIASLNERRRAIIHRAVTRGLDPSIPLKPSGILWLGDIPRHWEVRRMKSLSVVKRGASPRPIADMRYFDEAGEYAWVRIKDVTASNRYLERTTERLSALGKSRSVALEPGAIFLSIAGSVGKPIVSKIKCCIHDGFVYFPHFRGNAEFLFYVFSSGRVYDGLGKLGTQLNLNTETVGSIRVPWPSATEQGQIVAFLDRELRGFEVAVSRVEREIELLREYRTRLVANVTTGKLDVREAAASLPDESGPSKVEDDVGLSDEAELVDVEADDGDR